MKSSWIKLLISGIVLVGALILVSKLGVESNMEDMLPLDSPNLIASQEFSRYFDGQDQTLVVVKAETPDQAKKYLSELSQRLMLEDYIDSAIYKLDYSEMEPYLWAYMETEVYQAVESAIEAEDILALQGILSDLNMEEDPNEGYFASDDGRYFMMIVKPIFDTADFVNSRQLFYDGVHEHMNAVYTDLAYENFEYGLTGGALIQDIEADSVAFDDLPITIILTLALILVIVVLFFGRLRLPVLAMYPLVLGAIMAAAIGYILYQDLNMFSISFALLLLGLGIDYAVHLIARYQEERRDGKTLQEAVNIAQKSTGGSIIIGAVTTGFAFFMFKFSEFKALEQMGIISAAGVIVLCGVMLIVMPALISVSDKNFKETSKLTLSFKWLEKFTQLIVKRRVLVLVIIFSIIGLLIAPVFNTSIITDVSAIYPDNIPNLKWQDVVMEDFDYETDTLSTFIDDQEDLTSVVAKLEARQDIKQVDSILQYMPEDLEYKISVLEELVPILDALGVEVLSTFEIKQLTIDDLPSYIKDNYIGKDGKVRLEIIPAVNLYDQEDFETLVSGVEGITGRYPTGMAGIMNEVVMLVKRDVTMISILCLIAVLVLSALAFRSIKYALLTIIPLMIGLFITIGLVNVFKFDMNVFSIAAFPLVIGIGVDSGIHLIHRLREESELSLAMKVKETGRAIILTAITTMIGFGSLGNINHPGMSFLGLIVAMGIAVTMLINLILIPVLFTFFTKTEEFQTVLSD